MGKHWILKTKGDPLGTIRNFLYTLWLHAELDGILLPVYKDGEIGVEPCLVEEPNQLAEVDPIVPFVTINSAKVVAQLSKEHPDSHIGVILRSCEARALADKVGRGALEIVNWLLIGIDCLASFPMEDLEWRLKKAGTLENLTREALKFARLGNIAPYRFRQACQMCISPSCADVDLKIILIGLPVNTSILLSARNEEIMDRLGLLQITDGLAPVSLVIQHRRRLEMLIERRASYQNRKMVTLEEDLPSETASLLALFCDCSPCRLCLENCPIYEGELTVHGNGNSVHMDEVECWLGACVACGMCEQACPKKYPLTAIHSCIARGIRVRTLTNLQNGKRLVNSESLNLGGFNAASNTN